MTKSLKLLEKIAKIAYLRRDGSPVLKGWTERQNCKNIYIHLERDLTIIRRHGHPEIKVEYLHLLLNPSWNKYFYYKIVESNLPLIFQS